MHIEHQSRMRRVAGIEGGGTHSGFGERAPEQQSPDKKERKADVVSLEEHRRRAEEAAVEIDELRDHINKSVDLPANDEPKGTKASDFLNSVRRRLRA